MASHHVFDIEPVARFAATNAGIRRPKEIACFSYDDKHQFHLDSSSLRYYYPPLLPANLSKGFDTFQKLDDTADDHLDSLLDALVAYEEEKATKTEVDIITWRGMMTKIMTAVYSPLDDWEMKVTMFQGTLFIEENHEKKLESRTEQDARFTRPGGGPSQELMSYWGYKFETLSVLPQPWYLTSRKYIESREDEVVSNHAQYCSVVRTGFGKIKMIIGGEVDAVWDLKPEDKSLPINWVELKTNAVITNERDQVKFDRKLLRIWAQSFLLGVQRVVVGFRDANGILLSVETLDTQSIPEMVARGGRKPWNGQTCINFAAEFLGWLKSMITEGGVYVIRKKEKSPTLSVFKIEEIGHGDILSTAFLHWRKTDLAHKMAEREARSEEHVQSNTADLAPEMPP